MPRVSVIVAAFNSSATIAETLRSVADQTYSDWEVVVGDDCSTDDTAEVAEGFEGVRVVRSERNLGHAAPTRNLAAGHARGRLLALLDADDRWQPAYLERLVEAYDRATAAGERVGAVACDAQLEQGGTIRPRTYYDVMGHPDRRVGLVALVNGNPVYAGALVSREAFDAVGGFDEDLRGTDDHDLWLRLAEAGYEIAVVDEPLAIYRLSAGQLSADERAMAGAAAAVYSRALRRGRLTREQRRLARRRLAVLRAVQHVPGLSRLARNSRRRFTGD